MVLMVEFCWIMWCYRNVCQADRQAFIGWWAWTHTYTPSRPFSFHAMLIKTEEPQYLNYFFFSEYKYLYGNFGLNQWIWCWWAYNSLCSGLWWLRNNIKDINKDIVLLTPAFIVYANLYLYEVNVIKCRIKFTINKFKYKRQYFRTNYSPYSSNVNISVSYIWFLNTLNMHETKDLASTPILGRLQQWIS